MKTYTEHDEEWHDYLSEQAGTSDFPMDVAIACRELVTLERERILKNKRVVSSKRYER